MNNFIHAITNHTYVWLNVETDTLLTLYCFKTLVSFSLVLFWFFTRIPSNIDIPSSFIYFRSSIFHTTSQRLWFLYGLIMYMYNICVNLILVLPCICITIYPQKRLKVNCNRNESIKVLMKNFSAQINGQLEWYRVVSLISAFSGRVIYVNGEYYFIIMIEKHSFI